MFIYYFIFLVLTFFAIYSDRLTKKTKNQFFAFFGVFLIFFAGLRGLNVDRDYEPYLNYFKSAPSIDTLFTDPEYFFSRIRGTIEPSITLIMSSIKAISSQWFPVVIFMYALTSISLKLVAIKKLAVFPSYSLLIYFSSIFLLQDMTQIRIAVASGFLMLSIPHIVNRNLKGYVFLILVAMFFHYSAIVFAPFYFFNTKSINKNLYFTLISVSVFLGIIYFNPFDIIINMKLGLISQIVHAQVIAQPLLKKMNIFNLITLLNVILGLFFIFNSDRLKNEYSVILIKINSFSIIFYYLFSFSPIISYRTSEVLEIVQIILLPQLIYIIKPKMLAEGIIIIVALLYFINQVLVNPILKPYVCIFQLKSFL